VKIIITDCIHAGVAHSNTKAPLRFAVSFSMEDHGLAYVAWKVFSINQAFPVLGVFLTYEHIARDKMVKAALKQIYCCSRDCRYFQVQEFM